MRWTTLFMAALLLAGCAQIETRRDAQDARSRLAEACAAGDAAACEALIRLDEAARERRGAAARELAIFGEEGMTR
jgi:uncharacterized protein YceK